MAKKELQKLCGALVWFCNTDLILKDSKQPISARDAFNGIMR
jgi:hypothetical protein